MSNAFSEILEGQGLTDTRADELGKAVAPLRWQGTQFDKAGIYQAISRCEFGNLRWLEKYYFGLLLVADEYAKSVGYKSPLDTLNDYKDHEKKGRV
jgi:hypothetical protein